MKENTKAILALLIIVLAIYGTWLGVAFARGSVERERQYPTTMIVRNIDTANDLVRMSTASGHIYEMYGVEDYNIGDAVALIMSNNGTADDVTDDIIVQAQYSGFKGR